MMIKIKDMYLNWLKNNIIEDVINENMISLRVPYFEGNFKNFSIIILKYNNDSKEYYEIRSVSSFKRFYCNKENLLQAIHYFINLIILTDVPEDKKLRLFSLVEKNGIQVNED